MISKKNKARGEKLVFPLAFFMFITWREKVVPLFWKQDIKLTLGYLDLISMNYSKWK